MAQWKYEEYNDWSRMLADIHTKAELEKMLYGTKSDLNKSKTSHLNAILKTTSMQSNSQRRAQSRNSMAGNYEKKRAIENALEIHEFYPELCRKGLEVSQ